MVTCTQRIVFRCHDVYAECWSDSQIVMNYALVTCDCDGVSVYTERNSDEIVSFLLKQEGREVSSEVVAQGSTGLSDTDIWLMYEVELGKSLPDDISERFTTELRPMPGVVDAVRGLTTE